MIPSVDLPSRLQTVRSHYRVTPWIQPRDDESPLLRSWQRCRDAGMQEHERVSFELVSRSLLAELEDTHGDFIRHARPETERLAQALRGTGATVLLFNQRGVVIDRLGHDASTPAALMAASRLGVNVSERCVGTSAPAIALAEGLPYLVGRDAHFFANVRPFFCVAAPIDGPQGQRLGALDISTYDSVPAFDVLSLVVDAAAAIENSLFLTQPDTMVLHFHPRAELLGTALEGLLQVDAHGRISGANRAAQRLLCVPREQLMGKAFSDLFDRRLHSGWGAPARPGERALDLRTHQGLQVFARVAGPHSAPVSSPAVLLPEAHQPAADVAPPPANMRELERQAIERTLAANGGNVSVTARQLGISRNTIYRRRRDLV